MTAKEELLEKIRRIDDESFLADLMLMVDLELDLSGGEICLSEEHKTFIDKGLLDKANDNLMTHAEAKRKTQEWLKGK